MSKHLYHTFLQGCIFGITAILSFLLVASALNPSTSGEAGVPVEGYLYHNMGKILGIPASDVPLYHGDGMVVNASMIDNILPSNFQRAVTGSCPVGEWAYGVDPTTGAIKCRAP